MRRVAIALLALLLVLIAPQPARAAGPPAVGATEVAVLDAATGRLLYGKNERAPVHPASLTKMVTALVALEVGRLDDLVAIDVDARAMPRSTVMGLRPGMILPLEDLLYGLMLPSGNDAALAIARHLAGSEAAFVAMMNHRVHQMGLQQTHFVNPHGLDHPYHLSTAEDLARIAREAMQNEHFVRIVSTLTWTVRADPPYPIANLNLLLGNYPGADGVKVGYTRRAGRAYAASATRDGHRMIAVVLRSPNPAAESAALLDWAFAQRRADVEGAS
ncbi:MAG: D-alanyl-D-alanine carboxypeptidase family protein [Chloroflexota bacterium]|nr:D-alanyl-D-alanine carboxypeptidase [Dehalococcoidia bacterium]MDW8254502.1 D-alanyl-D-alanine carboxypeptidase family protein [Chloroflexota bacterium]